MDFIALGVWLLICLHLIRFVVDSSLSHIADLESQRMIKGMSNSGKARP